MVGAKYENSKNLFLISTSELSLIKNNIVHKENNK